MVRGYSAYYRRYNVVGCGESKKTSWQLLLYCLISDVIICWRYGMISDLWWSFTSKIYFSVHHVYNATHVIEHLIDRSLSFCAE